MNELRQDLYEISQQFDIDVPALQGDLTCAFVGEWNHGKSSLINSILDVPYLPEKRSPTTKTTVRLTKSTELEPRAIIYKDSETKTEYQGQAAIEALQESTQQIFRIEYSSPQLDIPTHTAFLDTPGFNDTDQANNTKAETVQADVIVFVLNCKVSALNQSQVNFIQQVGFGKGGEVKDLFFVFTHSDLLEVESDYDDLKLRVGGHVDKDNFFFLSNKNQQGVKEFKDALYSHLNERKEILIEQRCQRYDRDLTNALQQKVVVERTVLTQLKIKNEEEREELQKKIQEARNKERNKKNELRNRNQLRLRTALQEMRELIACGETQVSLFVDECTVEELQRKGNIQEKIQEVMTTSFQPQVKKKLEDLLHSTNNEISEGQLFSRQLIGELDIDFPDYTSKLSSVAAENIMPLAVAGSYLMFGWFSIPTLLLGYMTIKASDFGLTRVADKTGMLDTALDKIKQLGASGYKHAVKITVAKTFTDYLNQISDHFNEVLEKSTEQAIEQINFVEQLEKAMQRATSSTEIVQLEMNLEKAETILNLK